MKQLLPHLRWAATFLILFSFAPAFSQNKTIKGSVKDNTDGSNVSGASVTVKGTSIGTKTDGAGRFEISVPESTSSLQVTFIGYLTQDVSITGRTNITVQLVQNTTNLSEVQVVSVGYGSQRKKDITGAVSAVSSKDFNKGQIVNPLTQIQGKVAGLNINISSGDPNAVVSVRLRGQASLQGGNTPLFVIDGIPLDDPNQIQNIPPGDIESYDVLKDASSTAIYGSRAANGVIIVNTKRGKSGKSTIDYAGAFSIANQSKYYDLLNADEFRAAYPKLGIIDQGGNTDWQRAMSRTAYTHTHNVAISGGSNTFNYRGSVNYQNEQGTLINTGVEQTGLRFNAQQKAINDKLVIDLGIQNVTTNRHLFDNNNYNFIFNSPPTYPIYKPDGSYYYFTDFAQANPVAHQKQEINTRLEHLTLMNAALNYTIVNGLKVGFTGSISHENKQGHFYFPAFPVEANFNGASEDNNNIDSKKGDAHVNFDKTYGKHNISLTGVYEYNYFNNSGFAAGASRLLVPENTYNNLGTGNPLYNSVASGQSEYKLISFLARAAYNYNDKYYLTATIRRDGSSKFGSDNAWGNFPSFSVAYRFKKDLLQEVAWVDDIKLRAGYGVTGNSDAINPYNTLNLFGPGGRYFNAADGSYPQSYSPVQNPNPHLRWEERHGSNIGLDFTLFGGRLTGDMNYFSDKTKYLLYNYTVPTPPFVINTILANVGTLTNKGFELQLTGQIIKSTGFNWTVNATASNPKTKITSLSGTFDQNGTSYPLITDKIPVGSAAGRGLSATPITYLIPGSSPNTFYLPHYTGIDANGNQLLDGQTTTANPNPKSYYTDPAVKLIYGIGNNFGYKNWSLSFFLNGNYGSKAFNNTLLDIENINRLPGENTTKAALTNGVKDAALVSDKWLESTSFLRLQSASLSYGFDHLNIPGIQAIRLSVSGNNLFVITKYRGQDPEVQIDNANGNLPYIDVAYSGQAHYPRSRQYTFGLNVTFK